MSAIRKKAVYSHQGRCCSFFKTNCEHFAPVVCEFPRVPSIGRSKTTLRQLSIEEAYTQIPDRSKKASLEQLPPDIRQRIYIYSGIPHQQRIVLVSAAEPDYIHDQRQIISSLSLVCRLVNEDVTNLLYSDNYFVIYHTQPGDLQRLRNFGPRIYKCLQSLELHMRLLDWRYDRGSRSYHDGSTVPLDLQSRRIVDMCDEWLCTAKWLAQYLSRKRLKLRFYCEVTTLSAARIWLKPFTTDYMPDLAECVISVCRPRSYAMKDHAISDLVRAARAQRTAWKPAARRFLTFQSLPTELQLRILGFTDLVVPFREVQCHSRDDDSGWYSISRLQSHCGSVLARTESRVPPCDTLIHHACQYFPLSRHCEIFCRRKGVADPLCHCWSPPTALFLVSKGFRRLAQEMFFSCNHFAFTPWLVADCGRDIHSSSVPECPPSVYQQLRRVQQQRSLHWLRRIELVLPTCREGKYEPLPLGLLQDWTSAITLLRTQAALSSLEVSILLLLLGPEAQPISVTLRHSNYILNQTRLLLSPLLPRRGLRSFRAIILRNNERYPYKSLNLEGVATRAESPNQRFGSIEQELERMVMGDEYAANHRAKAQRILRWRMSLEDESMRCSCTNT